MAVYQRIFSNPDVADTHVLFLKAVRAAELVDAERRRAGLPAIAAATRAQLLRAYDEFNRDMESHAQITAQRARENMQRRLKQTAKRPDTGLRPHLRQALLARPLRRFGPIATGEVGIAPEENLDKVVNPTSPSYGPYWRAQEFGTGSSEVKSQKGRVIHGYFFDTGLQNPTVPQKNRSDQPIFVSGRAGGVPVKGGIGPKGGKGGRGVIGQEIQGRHFIRDGANDTLPGWLAGIRRIERQTERRLDVVLRGSRVRTPAQRAARRVTGPRRRPPRR